jgi:hypothetical protein
LKIRHLQVFAMLAAAVYVPACADSSSGTKTLPTDLEATVQPLTEQLAVGTVVVTPATSSIAAGATVQLTAKSYNSSGAYRPKAAFNWSSSNTAIATVNASGLVTGVAAGTATITATTQQTNVSGTASVTVTGTTPPPPPPGAQTLIAAGDIAVCSTTYDEATANIIDGIPGTVAVLGDNADPDGSATDYANCYAPSWGRHKARTMPSIGNHEYVSGGTAYFNYFGASAGSPSKGYYSYDLGDWHIVVLNSNCTIVACTVGSAQEVWLRADLAATTKSCILAYWHHPRFSSDASHGGNTNVATFWNALYQYGADVVLNGHAHVYERFGLQNPSAVADANGIREFIVGTGGKSPFYNWGTIQPNSQVRNNATFGVLKLTLGTGTYSWNFMPVAGKTWTDSGTTACH